jgi:putative ABC transport system permease protein
LLNLSSKKEYSKGFLQTKWDEFAPGQPFEYSFLDERFNNLYENEQRIGNIFSVFAGLAVFIACLGLYGLSAFTAEQKTKEIGIRKVLGASITQILILMSREFTKLVIISFLLGVALSYFAMREWLNDFAYRININNPTIFIIAGIVSILIAWITMSVQSFAAARSNPVKSLKEE